MSSQNPADRSVLGKRRDGHAQGKPSDEVLPSVEERLEAREKEIEDSVRGNKGLSQVQQGRGLDKSETEESLKRATGGLGEGKDGSH